MPKTRASQTAGGVNSGPATKPLPPQRRQRKLQPPHRQQWIRLPPQRRRQKQLPPQISNVNSCHHSGGGGLLPPLRRNQKQLPSQGQHRKLLPPQWRQRISGRLRDSGMLLICHGQREGASSRGEPTLLALRGCRQSADQFAAVPPRRGNQLNIPECRECRLR